jgi:hypothetical protein
MKERRGMEKAEGGFEPHFTDRAGGNEKLPSGRRESMMVMRSASVEMSWLRSIGMSGDEG